MNQTEFDAAIADVAADIEGSRTCVTHNFRFVRRAAQCEQCHRQTSNYINECRQCRRLICRHCREILFD